VDSLMLHRKEMDYYITRLKRGMYFSLAGYSDAEFYCMMNKRIGTKTGLGQILDSTHGDKLFEVLDRRQLDLRFLISIPQCLWDLPEFSKNSIGDFFLKEDLEIEAYERDMILDDLARDAGLFPFIKQLQKMNVVVVGNKDLRKLDFLKYKHFVEISSPNLHIEEGGIGTAVKDCINFLKNPPESPVFLISAGVSAAVIIDELHDVTPSAFFIDCGSIWDAFVGVGGQREWRAELYANREKWRGWIRKNLHGED
jgi:hypothetical protein